MDAYFKPRRRKIGVLTLVMASVFSAAWVRSIFKIDEFAISPQGESQFIFLSAYQKWGLRFYREPPLSIVMSCELDGPRSIRSETSFTDETFFERREGDTHHGTVERLEFRDHRGRGRVNDTVINLYPYWAVVIPLTVISACLLLSKPNRPMLKMSNESIQGVAA